MGISRRFWLFGEMGAADDIAALKEKIGTVTGGLGSGLRYNLGGIGDEFDCHDLINGHAENGRRSLKQSRRVYE